MATRDLSFALLCVIAVLSMACGARASHPGRPLTAHCDCAVCEVCCPTLEEVTEEKTEWKVECEKTCIPAIRFPWENGGSKLTLFSWWGKGCGADRGADDGCSCAVCSSRVAHGGEVSASCAAHGDGGRWGKVRAVNVLSEETREETVCKCKWEIRRVAWRIPSATDWRGPQRGTCCRCNECAEGAIVPPSLGE